MMKSVFFTLVLASVLLCGTIVYAQGITDTKEYVGQLEMIHEDDLVYFRSAEIVVSLWTPDNKEIKLNTSMLDRDFLRRFRTADEVSVKVLDNNSTKKVVVDIRPTSGKLKREVEVTGSRKIVHLLIDLNSNTRNPCTVADVTSTSFTGAQSIHGVYSDMSGGTLIWDGDVDGNPGYDIFGPFNLNLASIATCDYSTWADQADSAATASGVNLSLYQHKAYILPAMSQIPACQWSGMGTVGCGTQCRTWTTTCHDPSALSHELGHNLGLNHANKWVNGAESAYLDYSCIMAASGFWREFNQPHKVQLGWTPAANIIDLTSGFTGTRTYTMSASELVAPANPQAVKLQSSYSGRFYVVSFRAPSGNYDTSSNGMMQPYYNVLSIHTHDGSGTTILMATIGVGQTYTDSTLSITINLISVSGLTAQVQITSGSGSASSSSASSSTAASSTTGVRTSTSTSTSTSTTASAATTSPSTTSSTTGSTGKASSSGSSSTTGSAGSTTSSNSGAATTTTTGRYTGRSSSSSSSSNSGTTTTTTTTTATTATTSSGGSTTGSGSTSSGSTTGSGSSTTTTGSNGACSRTPIISATPASLSGSAGSSINTVVLIGNMNPSTCPNIVYTLTTSAPSGWSMTSPLRTMTLRSQTASQVLVTVTPARSQSGSYTVSMSATDPLTGVSAQVNIPFTLN